MLTIIVAMDDQQLIGREGGLPWQIPEDLKFFKETTLHHSLLVGHQTLKGLPRLNDRKIYGVSRH
ncbi:MAG TPA: dihydrofolate reductase, partial [Erysipelothrix sp.]|nr:dihydrofolate reductase [Erysipelothrix sp.]